MIAGVQNAVIITQQLVTTIATDFTKLIVTKGDVAFYISDGNNGMLIQRIFLFSQFIHAF